jgi:hypothetical protein
MRNVSLSTKVITKMSLVALIMGTSVGCNKFGGGDDGKESGAEVMRGLLVDLDCFPEEIYASNSCGLDLASTIAEGAIITESSATFPKIVTFDYGNGCIDHWGRTRKGKVIVEVSGDMANNGSVTSVSFDEFSINDVSIEGTRLAENVGNNAAGNIVVHYSGDLTISKNDRSRTFSFKNQREWINGSGTCAVDDDEFYITGGGSMTTCDEKAVNVAITKAIHFKMRQCEYPLEGRIDVGSDKRGATLDFGAGECDNIAEVTVKRRNKTHRIDLDTREMID